MFWNERIDKMRLDVSKGKSKLLVAAQDEWS